MRAYVNNNRARFRTAGQALSFASSRTKPGTKAKTVLSALLQAAYAEGAPEQAQFSACTTPVQTIDWVLSFTDSRFTDPTETLRLLHRLRTLHQKGTFSAFFTELDRIRLLLGLTNANALQYALSGMDPALARAIGSHVGKLVSSLSWEDLESLGSIMEYEMKLAAGPRPSLARAAELPADKASVPARAVAVPIELPCKIKRFSESPAVPQNLRGRIKDTPGLRDRLVTAAVCLACRRPASDHGGEKGPGLFASPRTTDSSAREAGTTPQ
jgi:hypothetical protein